MESEDVCFPLSVDILICQSVEVFLLIHEKLNTRQSSFVAFHDPG